MAFMLKSNVRHEQGAKGHEAGFGTFARWPGQADSWFVHAAPAPSAQDPATANPSFCCKRASTSRVACLMPIAKIRSDDAR